MCLSVILLPAFVFFFPPLFFVTCPLSVITWVSLLIYTPVSHYFPWFLGFFVASTDTTYWGVVVREILAKTTQGLNRQQQNKKSDFRFGFYLQRWTHVPNYHKCWVKTAPCLGWFSTHRFWVRLPIIVLAPYSVYPSLNPVLQWF